MKPMRIALLGLGSVGRGVAKVLANPEYGFVITAAADSKSGAVAPLGGTLDMCEVFARKNATGKCGDSAWSAERIVREAEYDILVEVSPTNAQTGEPALSNIRAALMRGKHVVTSNKGPISIAYPELSAVAKEHNAGLMFEGTVAGAVPIMNGLRHGLAGNRVNALFGVLNGTCNYILTRMEEEGLTYQQALLEASDLGYAEADPSADVNGTDAAIKLVILANTMLGMNVTLDEVVRVGIDGMTADALMMAGKTGHTIRLIASIHPDKRQLEVSPRLIHKEHPLVVDGTLNAVTVDTELAGPVTFIGRGAGSVETASAVLADLIALKERYGDK
ncbi:Homoserine dehydrogenase [Methanocorpusculaceae archaeon Sp1]|nr:Homoserine dehydrogenase [Methanocorpusculaceae archaeon Sp1]